MQQRQILKHQDKDKKNVLIHTEMSTFRKGMIRIVLKKTRIVNLQKVLLEEKSSEKIKLRLRKTI